MKTYQTKEYFFVPGNHKPTLKTNQFLFLFLLTLFTTTTLAQQKITGRVAHGDTAVVGATVLIKGTNTAAQTDETGRFSISAPADATLVITAVGFGSQEISVGGRSTIDVSLTGRAEVMNEVVVVGYGTARRRDVTGAINTVNARDFGNNSATQPAQMLQGKAPGVQVLNNSGVPGGGANIVIRGVGSFTNVSPLYVIDGIQSDPGLFNAINPQDIESITILKDAASTAIYGASAANGVVLVTTKRARAGAPKISIISQWGVARRPKKLDVLNAAQYLELAKDYAQAQGSVLPEKFNSPDITITRTDWQDEVFRTAPLSNNSISVSGGSTNVLYSLSVGYIDQQAIVQDYHYRALNIRFSLEEKLGIFRFGQSLNTQFLHNTGNPSDLPTALYMPPYFDVYDSTRLGGFTAATNVKDLSNAGNPLVTTYTRNTVNNNYLLYPQFFGEVNILKSLRFRSQLAVSIGGNNFSEFQKPYINGNDLATGRSATEAQSTYNWYLLENYATWNPTFGKHSLQVTLGNSYRDKGRSSFVRAQGTGLANDVVQNISVALTNTVTGASVGYGNPNVGISYFGRLIYNFNDKYILSASMRRDGSSVFGPANKFGNFPGFGIAWNISNENFMKGMKAISDLKLRASWGKVGNSSIAPFQTSPTTYSGNPTGNLVYSFGPLENFYSGTTINFVTNPNLKWEETVQTDVGVDFGLLNNALSVTVDWYNRENNDLLINVPIPNSTGTGGVSGGPTLASNAASATNTGVEAGITYRGGSQGGFRYTIGVNGGYNKNKVTSLGSQFTAPIRAGSFNQNAAATYTAVGYPIGSFYGRQIDHVAIDQADIDRYDDMAQKTTGDPNAVYQANLKPGDFIFKDLNGNGTIDDNDVTVLGNPIPKFVYGGTITLGYKNFDFNAAFAGVSGLKIYKELNYQLLGTAALHNVSTEMLNRWRKPGDIATLPMAGQNPTANLQPSDLYIEDGSYARLRMLTLGYTFSGASLSGFTKNILTNARIYVSAENLITITNYSGYDPEISNPVGSNAALDFILTRGIDRGQLPQPKTFLIGIQLGL